MSVASDPGSDTAHDDAMCGDATKVIEEGPARGYRARGRLAGSGRAAAGAIDAEAPLDPAIHARRWLILATLCVSLLIIVIDNTILNVAIPSMMDGLGASNSEIQWILDAYILVFAGLLLATGTLSDRYGRKGVLQIGIVWFALASMAAALSSTPGQLIAARAFMGAGAAMIMPSTLSILTNVFHDPKERGRAIAVWAGVTGVGVALGPMTGGALLAHFDWGSVFWVNVPIAAVALTAGYFLVPTSRGPKGGKLDPLGAIMSIAGLLAVVYSIIEGPQKGWTDATVVAGFNFGVAILIAFVVWELRCEHPMLPMTFFKNMRFSVANASMAMTSFALVGSTVLMTQYWQFVHQYTPLEAGVRMIPNAATLIVFTQLSGRIVERIGTKIVVAAGLLIAAIGLGCLSFIHANTPYWTAIGLYSFTMVGVGSVFTAATDAIMGSLPRDKAGVGSGMNNTTRQVGGALGVAVIGSIVNSTYSQDIDGLVGRFHLSSAQAGTAKESLSVALDLSDDLGSRAGAFAESVRVSFVDATNNGMRFGAIILLAAAAIAWKFLPARGADLASARHGADGGAGASISDNPLGIGSPVGGE